MGIDSPSTTNVEDPALASDTNGVWLHKLVWARTGPGGVYPLYWYTANISGNHLHHIYGEWNRFMSGIPQDNGRYVDAAAVLSNQRMRAFGQKDVQAGWAHLWIDRRARL